MTHAAGEQLHQHLIWAWVGKLYFIDHQWLLGFDVDCGTAFGAHKTLRVFLLDCYRPAIRPWASLTLIPWAGYLVRMITIVQSRSASTCHRLTGKFQCDAN